LKKAKITFIYENENYDLLLYYNEGKASNFFNKELFKIKIFKPSNKEILYTYPFPGVWAAMGLRGKKFYFNGLNNDYFNILSKLFKVLKIDISKIKNLQIQKFDNYLYGGLK
jgi:hypothetical protein